ncbi:hypothetical protein [Amycolatopsis sp. NPDC051128]|uniref:hypothetical protein n=1 Tax=Amycolatopsis sp. NPDC051128 TaxID=3155412 RepID=UPI00343DF12F
MLLPLEDVADEPAGRLYAVLSLFHGLDGQNTLGSWWGVIAGHVATGGDAVSVRAEVAALLGDVERNVYSLSHKRHNQQALLRRRDEWAKPIFGFGVNDSHPYTSEVFISEAALDSLSALSSILKLAVPEHGPRREADIVATLDEVYDMLGRLKLEVANAPDIPEVARVRITQQLMVILERITYVRLRGFSSLVSVVQNAAIQVEIVAERTIAERSATKSVLGWLGALHEIIRKIELIAVPPFVGVATGIASRSLETGLASGAAARIGLESLKKVEKPKEIEAGKNNGQSQLDSPPSEG